MEITLGPARCHDCHAPALFWAEGKWQERQWRFDRKLKTYLAVLVPHRCTAHVGQPMFNFSVRRAR